MSNNNNTKVKGLLKGLRFISQIFDNEGKDSGIEIGHPTDVKHVAHIGCDGLGASENDPTWMNEFKSVPGNSSASKKHNGDIHSRESNSSIQRASEDSMERSSRSVNSEVDDGMELAKSKRQSNSMGNMRESRAKEKSDRPRHPKRSSKSSKANDSFNASKHTDQVMQTDDNSLERQDSDLPPRKSRPKISKDGSSSSSSKSRTKAQSKDSNPEGHHARRSSKSRNKHTSYEEENDEPFQRGSNENILKSYVN